MDRVRLVESRHIKMDCFGPSLPPGVTGSCIGTLAIRVISSSVPNFLGASLEFWGTVSEQHINVTRGIKFPLVGTVASVEKYLHDASPLSIKIIGVNGILGVCSIAALTLTDLTVQESKGHPIFSHRYSLRVSTSEQNPFDIGCIRLDVSFHVGHANNDKLEGLRIQNRSRVQQGNSIPQLTGCVPVYDQDNNTNESLDEQQSLLDDLLDLCDDVTIPTLPESCNTPTNYTDPCNQWISRIEKRATTYQQHSNQTRSLEIRVGGISIFSEILDSLSGKKIYLRFTVADCSEEILVSNGSTRSTNSNARTPLKTMKKNNHRLVELLDKPVGNEITIHLSDKETSDFDGGIQFQLYSSHVRGQKPKTPKQKKNASNTPVPLEERKCVATATFTPASLLNDSVTVDLVSAESSTKSAVNKVGILTLLLSSNSLVSDATSDCVLCQEERTVANSVASSCSERVPDCRVGPHPVSLFLANFANQTQAKKREQLNVDPADNHDVSVKTPIQILLNNNNTAVSETQSQPTKCVISKSTTLRPVRPPPLWMSVVVSGIKLESRNQQCKVGLKLSCDLAESSIDDEKIFDSQCVWQFSLRDRDAESVALSIELMDTLSLSSVAFAHLNINKNASPNDANGLPALIKSGWFDAVGSSCQTTTGKIQIQLCIGTLKNTRSFPRKCICAVTIQRWWRRASTKSPQQAMQNIEEDSASTSSKLHVRNESEDARSAIGSNPEVIESSSTQSPAQAITSDGSKNTSVGKPTPYQKEEFGEATSPISNEGELVGSSIHMVAMSVKCDQEQRSLSSSPDSLFEEWSRQSAVDIRSLSTSREFVASQTKVTAEQTSVTDPPSTNLAADYDGAAFCSKELLTGRLEERKHDESEYKPSGSPELLIGSIPPDPPAGDIDSETIEQIDQQSADCASQVLETHESKILPEHEKVEKMLNNSFDAETKSCSHCRPEIKIEVCVLKVGGLSHIVSLWRERSQSTVLPVSGFFISCSTRNESSEEKELRDIFSSDYGHCCSSLILMPSISRDVEFDDFKSVLSIPDYELDLAKLQLQCLELKLWHVPVVTRAIAEMFSQDKFTPREANCLSGCKLVATASLPLYHLHTPQAHFDDRVAWSVDGQLGSYGFVAARVHNLHETSPTYHMKPMTLERSFCSSAIINRRQSVDPPPSSSMSNKRKVGSAATTHDEEALKCRSIKRTRIMPNASDTLIDEKSAQMMGEPDSGLTYQSDNKCPHVDVDSCASKNRQEGTMAADKATPEQEFNIAVHKHAHTCERGSSPVIVALRCADAGVCTSPYEEPTNDSTARPSRQPVTENNDSATPLHPDTAEDSESYMCHRNAVGHSNLAYTASHEPVYESDLNKAKPHRLRSQLMQNYFSSSRASYSAAESYRFDQNTFNRTNSVSFGENVKSPPVIGSRRTVHASAQNSSPTMKPLSNKERIERIFSGKK